MRNKEEILLFYNVIASISNDKKEKELINFMIENIKKGITPMSDKRR